MSAWGTLSARRYLSLLFLRYILAPFHGVLLVWTTGGRVAPHPQHSSDASEEDPTAMAGHRKISAFRQAAQAAAASSKADVTMADVVKAANAKSNMKNFIGEIQAGHFAFSARIPEHFNHAKERKKRSTMRLRGRRGSAIPIHISEPKWIEEELKELNDGVKWHEKVIHPNSHFRRTWDVFVVLFVTFYIVVVPLEFGFFWWEDTGPMTTLSYIIDVFFWFDIFLNFRTGYIEYGDVVLDRKRIAKKYLFTWFIVDLISLIPFELFAATDDSDLKYTRKSVKLASKWLKIPKLLRLARVMKSFKRHGRFKPIVEVLAATVLLLHITACMSVLTSLTVSDVLTLDISDFEIYATGLRNALHMCMGSPVSRFAWGTSYPISSNVVLEVVCGILGVCILVIAIACITIVVSQKTVAYARFRQKWDQVMQEMHYYHVPKHIQERAKQYYEYLWVHQKHHSFNSLYHESSNLSLNLRKEVALFLHRDLVLAVPLFRDVSMDCAAAVAMAISVQIYMPEDWIIREEWAGNVHYFQRKGELSESGVAFVELSEGSFFGEIALLENIGARDVKDRAVRNWRPQQEFFHVLTETILI